MPRSSHPFRRRLLLVALPLAVLVAVFWSSAFASAQGPTRCGTEMVFYSDATHTEEVGLIGWEGEKCGCSIYSWGVTTIYRVYRDGDICV